MKTRNLAVVVAVVAMWSLSARGAEIHDAVAKGDIELVKSILAKTPRSVNSWDEKLQRTPLHIAAQTDQAEMARLLIEKGAALNPTVRRSGKDSYVGIGMTPLHIAAGKGSVKMTSLLIESGANVNAGTAHLWTRMRSPDMADHEALFEIASQVRTHQQTPLHFAAIMDRRETARLLLEAGAKVDSPDFNQNTPAMLAAYFGSRDTLALLLDKGANPKAANSDGFGIIHFAAATGQVEIADMMAKRGASPSLAACNQEMARCTMITPLHLASISGDAKMVEKLLALGANPKAKAARGSSALDLAKMQGADEAANLLLSFGGQAK